MALKNIKIDQNTIKRLKELEDELGTRTYSQTIDKLISQMEVHEAYLEARKELKELSERVKLLEGLKTRKPKAQL